MKKTLFLIMMLIGISVSYGQIPAEVTDVMNRCRTAMNNPNGLEYEMDVKAGMGPVSMNMHFIIANKGELNRTQFTIKILGKEVSSESGFDGTQTWEIDRSPKGDTITITPGKNMKKSKGDLQLDLDKQYKKAKIKLKDGYYVITFSEPIDSSNEVKSITIKISEKNYTVREVRSGARGAKVTMTITKIRVGLKDSHFKLNLAQYPNAVVIRK